ncbi:Homeobox-leucine zipper protein [Musa troglodytarum]|uniref:Homeobox-leucine zipper protein n=1 Tax=Musa troglodytarum TaxID=320322 RepID=A0A9E7ELN2_9LILI|nr:Homeobox-leucine zipper protein [Musa troglodytarum]
MEKEYLGLSLSLNFSSNGFPSHLSLLHSSSASQPSSSSCQPKPAQWRHLLHAHSESRPILDVNQAPSAAAGRNNEEDGGVSSPNSRASSATAKRSTEREAGSRGVSDEEDDGDGCRKKLRLSKDQSAILEESFKEHSTLNPKQKLALAKQLNLRPRQVEVWFQNRRARCLDQTPLSHLEDLYPVESSDATKTKLKQTEVDCELLRRCCQDLTEENRRLQKEVLELRALKLSPQLYMHMTPPTTLTLCPSCERACGSTSAALAAASSSRNQPPAEYHQFLHQHHRHQQRPVAPPWAPIQLRPSFLDAPPQRS